MDGLLVHDSDGTQPKMCHQIHMLFGNALIHLLYCSDLYTY